MRAPVIILDTEFNIPFTPKSRKFVTMSIKATS